MKDRFHFGDPVSWIDEDGERVFGMYVRQHPCGRHIAQAGWRKEAVSSRDLTKECS